MRTVEEAWMASARALGVNPHVIIEMRLRELEESHLHGLSARLLRLAEEVLLRLPEDWDSHVFDWAMAESDSADPELREKFDHLLAGSKLLLEEEDTQECHIKLCANRLARLSDPAVRGVIVHEFAHVASALPTDPRERHDALMENRADAIAGWWGFSEELQALSNETKPEPADETEA